MEIKSNPIIANARAVTLRVFISIFKRTFIRDLQRKFARKIMMNTSSILMLQNYIYRDARQERKANKVRSTILYMGVFFALNRQRKHFDFLSYEIQKKGTVSRLQNFLFGFCP